MTPVVSSHSQMGAWLLNVLPVPTLAITPWSRCLTTSRVPCSSSQFYHLYSRVVCCSSNATLFIGLDACFKFKLKDHCLKDPDLANGLAYMVPDTMYKDHVLRHAAAQSLTDVSHVCY